MQFGGVNIPRPDLVQPEFGAIASGFNLSLPLLVYSCQKLILPSPCELQPHRQLRYLTYCSIP